MLRHLTWIHFILAAGTCLLLYYASVLWLFYRQEIKVFLEHTFDRLLPRVYLTSGQPDAQLPEGGDTIAPETGREAEAPVITEAAELQFVPISVETGEDEADGPSPDTTTPDGSSHTPPISRQADFLQEITSLLELVAETNLEKEEFLSLLRLIMARYSRTLQARQRERLELFLLQETGATLPFPLYPEDLQALWHDA